MSINLLFSNPNVPLTPLNMNTWNALAGPGAVTTVVGTDNQVDVSNDGGTATVSLATNIILPSGSIDCQSLASNSVISGDVYSNQISLTNVTDSFVFTFPLISATPSQNDIIIANNSGGSSFSSVSTLLSSDSGSVDIVNNSGIANLEVDLTTLSNNITSTNSSITSGISAGKLNLQGLESTNGTFTPTLSFGGGSTGITYASQQGYYTSIGGIVVFTINISMSSKGSSTGSIAISGFPFSGRALLSNQNAFVSGNSITFSSGYLIAGFIGTTFTLYNVTSVVGSLTLDDTNFTDTSDIFLSGSVLI